MGFERPVYRLTFESDPAYKGLEVTVRAPSMNQLLGLESTYAEAAKGELVWQVDLGEEPEGPADVVIDASVADAVPGHLAWALETGTNLVIGATGWSNF